VQQRIQGTIPNISKKELVRVYIDKYVENIKKNIAIFFKYGNKRNYNQMEMIYFDNKNILVEFSYK
jgi:hypothetical protein